jgi:hypothetical protein
MKKLLVFNLICFVCGSIETNDPLNPLTSNANFCGTNETCVRFCCGNKSLCLDEHFDLSSVNAARNLDTNIKILRNRPNCSLFEEDEEFPWEFLRNGEILENVNGVEYIYSHQQYCIHRNVTHLRLMLCLPDENEESEEIPSENYYPLCKSFLFRLIRF